MQKLHWIVTTETWNNYIYTVLSCTSSCIRWRDELMRLLNKNVKSYFLVQICFTILNLCDSHIATDSPHSLLLIVEVTIILATNCRGTYIGPKIKLLFILLQTSSYWLEWFFFILTEFVEISADWFYRYCSQLNIFHTCVKKVHLFVTDILNIITFNRLWKTWNCHLVLINARVSNVKRITKSE